MNLFKIFLSCIFLCSGCFLRYNWEKAVENLPKDSKVLSINNDYILFINDGKTNKAYYRGDGEIYAIKQ